MHTALKAQILGVILCANLSGLAAQDLYDTSQVKTIQITAPSNWRTLMANNYASQALIKVDVTIDGKTYREVGARHRGFSTYRFLPTGKTDKRPWKLLFDEYVNGQEVQGYRTLNLNNNIWDPSMMREVVGYEFMRRYIRAPKCCFVQVKVNNEDLGIFTNTQQINKDFLDEHFRDDSGNRYRGDRPSTSTNYNETALTWLGTSVSRYQAAYELKTENGPHTPWVKLVQLCDVLNNTSVGQLPSVLPREVDIDNALRFIAVANMTAWLDSYLGRTCKNFYIYEDPYHGQMTFQPWDLNNGFGGLTDGLGTSGIARLPVMYREADAQSPRPLFAQLVKVPKWRAAYLAHMRNMLPDMDWAKIGKRIEELRTFIRPYLDADTKRIYTMQQFDQNVTQAINVGFVTTPGLKPFFEGRFAFLSTESNMARQAPTLSDLRHQPASPKPNENVAVTVKISGVNVKEATLHWRVRGPFNETALLDDGLHGDGAANDGVYGATIPPQSAFSVIEYYVSANSDLALPTGAMSILPTTGSFQPASYRVQGLAPKGPILISEVLAKNDSVIRDEANEFEDYLELTNTGMQAITLDGMYLTDDASNPTKWKIPVGTQLAAGASIIVWCDEDKTQGPLHANFKLSADGEEVALFDIDGVTNLDWFAFGTQESDVSFGRLHGYRSFELRFPEPSPGNLNEAVPCGHMAYRSASIAAPDFPLAGVGAPKPGQVVDYAVAAAPVNSVAVLYLGLAASLEVPSIGTLLLDPLTMIPIGALATDGSGAGKLGLTIPADPSLAGLRAYFQAIAVDPAGFRLSTGVATRICP